MKIKQLTLWEAEFIAHSTASEMMQYDETMPPFSTRTPGRLESCLATPFQTFAGRPLYRFFYQRLAILFYLVIKNHPFKNGNKRMAVMLSFVFLFDNGKWIDIDPDSLYKLANGVAKSNPKDKEKVLNMLSKFFNENIVSV